MYEKYENIALYDKVRLLVLYTINRLKNLGQFSYKKDVCGKIKIQRLENEEVVLL